MTPKPTFDDLKEKFNEKHAKIEVLCNDAIHPSDFFELFKDSNKFVDINAIGVHEKYQRKGIASKLVLESMKVHTYICSHIISKYFTHFSRIQ